MAGVDGASVRDQGCMATHSAPLHLLDFGNDDLDSRV